MAMLRAVHLVLLFICCATLSQCAVDREALCGACKMIVDEVQYAIKKENPKKMIEVGSYRLDSQGKMPGAKKIKYAGSEAHVTELLEKVCDNANDYATSTDDNGRKSYIRLNARDGESISISNAAIGADTTESLKNACHKIVGEYEDDLIDAFLAKTMDVKKEMCEEITGRKSYIRLNARNGESISISNAAIGADTTESLKNAGTRTTEITKIHDYFAQYRLRRLEPSKCHKIMGEYEDDLIDAFLAKTMDVKKEMCEEITDYCSPTGGRTEL